MSMRLFIALIIAGEEVKLLMDGLASLEPVPPPMNLLITLPTAFPGAKLHKATE